MSLTALDDTAVTADRVTAGAHDPKALAAAPLQPPDRVELREYSRAVLPLTDEQAAALNRVGGGQYLSVAPGKRPGQWQVSAHSYVGSINVAGLQVLVRPKIPLRNLFLLLEVGLRPQDWHDEAVHFETTGDLLPALVSFFARTTETTLARGLYHSYRGAARPARCALRGRVDIARQLTQPGVVIPYCLQVHRVHCRLDRELLPESGRDSITARRPSAGHRPSPAHAAPCHPRRRG